MQPPQSADPAGAPAAAVAPALDLAGLAAVFAALPGGAAVFAADAPHFTVLAASDALLAATGRPREAVVGRPLAEAFPNASPDDPGAGGLESLRASVAAAVRTGAAQPMPQQRYDLQRPDGAWEARYWDAVNIPVWGSDGAPVQYVLHQTEDVTARVLGAEAQARAERRAADVLARMADAHLVLDREFRVVSLNAATERALGLTRDAMLGRTHWALFPASVDSETGRAYRRVVAEGVAQHVTTHYVGDGYDRHLEVDAYPTEEGGVAVFWRDVSERVRAAAALAAERERLRAVVLHMPAPLALLEGPEHRFTLVNEAFKRVSGGGRDVTGLTPPEAFPELAGSGLFELHDRVYGSGEPWVGPETLVRYDRDGAGVQDTWFDLRFEPVRDAAGGVTVFLNFAVDVTEQVRARREVERLLAGSEAARAALAASEARFRTVQDASPLGFAIHRPVYGPDGAVADFTLPYVNEAGARIVGRPREELLAGTVLGIWPGTGPEGVFADHVRVLETGEPHYREILYEHDGLAAGLTLTVVRIGEGPDAELGITFTDVTARLRAERERDRLLAELGAERERLRSLILHMPAPVALVEGPEHRFTLVNDAYRRVSGPRPDVVGRPLREAFPELAGQGLYEQFDRVAATGEPWVAPETLVRYDRDGTGVRDAWLHLRLEPVRDGGVDGAPGRVVGILNFNVDVTEQVRARREVERLLAESEAARHAAEVARREAEAANRAKGDFLAVMSHELRTPLNAIGGYAQLMELGLQGPVTPEQLTALGRIQRGQQHLLGLINSVLNYAKLEAGHVQYETADVPVAEAVAEVAALVAPQARAKGLEVAVAVCDARLAARADPEKVRQVLLNLLSNAVKFTRGGGTVTVGCARAADGRVALTVADTGRGIPADQLARVFAPFVQVDQRLTRGEEGTGLGLAISRDLARGMGGDLTAESTPGVGSTFTLTLPAV